MIMKKLFSLLLVSAALFSCGLGDTMETVVVGDRYSISIPSFLTKTNALNDEASLQYQNTFKGFYVIVIDESIEEMHEALYDNDLTDEYSADIDGYSKVVLTGFLEALNITDTSDIMEAQIGGMPARTVSMTGLVSGLDVFYDVAFVQGSESYYQILTWTLAGSEKKYKSKMDEIINSLREL